uniref:TAF6_C domain-containing protein n=1 Tax=Haemonchus placei TaxID=6290 RepID=A0A0N4X2R6_HAEPC
LSRIQREGKRRLLPSILMAQAEKKSVPEDSKISIFTHSKYKTGVDHSAWNRAYALSVIRQLGLRPDVITEAAVDYIMSNVNQVVRDVLTTALQLVAQGKRIKLEARDIENSIDIRGVLSPCTSSRAASNTQFHLCDSLNKTLYPNDYFMVDLRAIMNVTPRRMPYKRRIRKHWLVIEGEQPRVPENPVIAPSNTSSGQEGINTFQSSSNESLMEDGNRGPRTGNKLEQTLSRPITTHSLSLEVLHLLASDPGLQSLVPRFAVLIFEGVRCNIAEQNLPVLRNILRLLKTLIDNVQVNLDKCLHDIIPALCSCVVCRELCPDPEDRQHFRLREFAASILAMICKKLKASEQRKGRTEIANQNGSETGKSQSSAQKRYPRLPQLPMRAPGIIRPTHASVAKLRMFKYSKRHESGGLFRQSTSTPKPSQSGADTSQLVSALQSGQHPVNVPPNVRVPGGSQAPGPLPPVVVEPAFPPRRPPQNMMGEQPRAHPAVTVEPAFPRRPQGPPR